MEDHEPELKAEDLAVDSLGEPIIPSPLGLNTEDGDETANYVADARTVLYEVDRDAVAAMVRDGVEPPAFQMAGPRQKIYFDGGVVRAAIVTCGGLCPGINNVIRTLVMELHYRYGVRSILGIRYGYRGFIPKLRLRAHPPHAGLRQGHPRKRRQRPFLLPRAAGHGSHRGLPPEERDLPAFHHWR